MATQSTGGGSTTSFTNTPRAKDDNYAFLEDLLRSNSTLYSTATNTITLDVMSNDLGGAAKTLFSVEDGDGNPLTADYDLLAKDVNAAGVSAWELTLGSNWVRINNGKIEYRIADGSGIPGQGVDVNSLNGGQTFNDQFVYAIRLGNGTLSEATVKISVTGANDSATISVVGSSDNNVVEAGGTANLLAGDPEACGKLLVNDVDAGQNKFQAPSSSALIGTYGNFTFNPDTGEWKYILDNGLAATEALAQGQSRTETLVVTSLDGTDSYSINVTVTGTNDAPVAVAVADVGSAGENEGREFDVVGNGFVAPFTVEVGHGAMAMEPTIFAHALAHPDAVTTA